MLVKVKFLNGLSSSCSMTSESPYSQSFLFDDLSPMQSTKAKGAKLEISINSLSLSIKDIVQIAYETLTYDSLLGNYKTIDLVICHFQDDCRILTQDQTIQQAHLTEDASLLIVDTTPAAICYSNRPGLDEDAMLARLEYCPPDHVNLGSKIQIIFERLEREQKLADMMLLCGLRWPHEPAIIKIIEALTAIGSPLDIAPYASRNFTSQDISLLQKFWPLDLKLMHEKGWIDELSMHLSDCIHISLNLSGMINMDYLDKCSNRFPMSRMNSDIKPMLAKIGFPIGRIPTESDPRAP